MTDSTGASAFSDQTAAVPDASPVAPEPTPTEPATSTGPTKQTYPVRGVLWGVLFGLGLVIVAIVTRTIQLSLIPALVVLVLGIAVGTLWSLFGPAKAAST